MGTHWKRLAEAPRMSIHHICGEIRKNNTFWLKKKRANLDDNDDDFPCHIKSLSIISVQVLHLL